MSFQLFWDWSGVGLSFLLTLFGALVLILPGRLAPATAARIGLGRHVEALILVAAAVTVALRGMGNVPIYVGGGGVVAVSLLGGVVPTILAIYFLMAAGPLRLALSLPWIGAVSVVAFFASEPVEGMGIVSRAPWFYLPAVAAAVGGTVMGWRSLRAIPLAYSYGVLGGIIGADLLRIDWILSSSFTAASIGGAEALDLVFLLGLWSAALAALPVLARVLALRRGEAVWMEVARLARAGHARDALERATAQAERVLQRWVERQDLQAASRAEILERSTARPVFAQVAVLRDTPEPWNPQAVRRVLENLEGLARRLAVRALRDAAPRPERLAAGAIDLLPVLLVGAFAAVFAGRVELDPMPFEAPTQLLLRTILAQGLFVFWTMAAAHVLLSFVVEWATGGRSLGKRLMRLRVRSIGGGRPSGWDFFVRSVARLLDLITLYLVPFVASPRTGRQRLGDYFAQTYVQAVRPADASVPGPEDAAAPPGPGAAPAPVGGHEPMRPVASATMRIVIPVPTAMPASESV